MKTYNYIKILLIFLLIFPAGFTSYSQEKPEKEKPEKEKTYSDIINNKTETDIGLFDVHKGDDKYY